MTFVAFLRAINVGGHTVKMDALRQHFERLGFTDVETFIASGNVIFTSRSRNAGAMARRIEDYLRDCLGYEVKTFLRSGAEVAAIGRYEPFTSSRRASALTLNVGFLEEPLTPEALRALHALKTDIDDFHVLGREVYWLCTKRQSESTMSNTRLEKALKVRTTFRNLTTVARLAEKHLQRRI